jgi:aminoglycoside phosphotransferase (APT) family kinase protein
MSLEGLDDCLPAALRAPGTTITRMASGLSGAGVYRVEAAGETFVLKVSGEDDGPGGWRRKLEIQQRAAEAGLAPRIVHVDEARRAIVSAFVADRSFPAFYGDLRTREAAVALLGRTIRRVHELPLPAGAEATDPRGFLATIWSGVAAKGALPAFVVEAVGGVLGEEPPAAERAVVLSHNDINPTNLVYDGEQLILFDWERASANDPFFDLGAAALFFRMDAETCRKLLAAHDGAPAAPLPAGFLYNRRLVAVMCGTLFLHLARKAGHPGGEHLDSMPSLADCYQRLRSGAMSVAAPDGQWSFGLALVKASAEL